VDLCLHITINVHAMFLIKNLENIFTESGPDFMKNVCFYYVKFNVKFSIQPSKNFDIFILYFLLLKHVNALYVNRAIWHTITYSTNMYCIFFMYIKYIFILFYIFYYRTKIKVPQYVLNCSCN